MSHPFAPSMCAALALAERGRFATCPNPTVGAVLVYEGRIVAEGWHTAYGAPHAEVACLHDAVAKGVNPADCTLVVTLEPCHHHGKTPPCTEAIVAAGVRHVVVGLRDPNPEAGGGVEYLLSQGLNVECGVEESLCRDMIADFLVWQTTARPYVILKLAATMDGRIATRTGHSQWVSGEDSRAVTHALRAHMGRTGSAVLIGGGTLRTDNPRLIARPTTHMGEAQDIPQPLACVLTSRLPTLHTDITLLRERPSQTIFLTTPAAAASPTAYALRERGVRVWESIPQAHNADVRSSLIRLRAEGACPYVLCEGGAMLARSLLEARVVDEFHLHLAPKVLADNEARPLLDGCSPTRMDQALGLRIVGHSLCGDDIHITLRPAHTPETE